jgi:hypothetical protein
MSGERRGSSEDTERREGRPNYHLLHSTLNGAVSETYEGVGTKKEPVTAYLEGQENDT